MKQAQEIARHSLSEADMRRIMAERLAYGAEFPNRKQRKAREAALRRAK